MCEGGVPIHRDAAGRLSGNALYFSRSQIPFAREWDDSLLTADPPHFFLHLGLYAYRREFLAKLTRLPRSPLEKLESLEQLRVLAAGYPIIVGVVSESSSGIDTPADYQAFFGGWRGSPDASRGEDSSSHRYKRCRFAAFGLLSVRVDMAEFLACQRRTCRKTTIVIAGLLAGQSAFATAKARH